jgi:predicted transcriptional regulator
MSRVLLLSVRPRFARGLLGGTKTAEIRRRFPDVPEGMVVIIYSSSPEKSVLGTMRVRRLVRTTAEEIWRNYSGVIGIGQAELAAYLYGASESSVLELEAPNMWSRPVPLESLRQQLHVEPAQSFRYLTDQQLARLEDLSAQLESGLPEQSSFAIA